jgi:hypothetical protein
LAQAPTKPNNAPPRHGGIVTAQSMLPRRWKKKVPTMPVKMNVKSAVCIDALIGSAASAVSAGISRIPPTPTVPINTPTISATSQIIGPAPAMGCVGSSHASRKEDAVADRTRTPRRCSHRRRLRVSNRNVGRFRIETRLGKARPGKPGANGRKITSKSNPSPRRACGGSGHGACTDVRMPRPAHSVFRDRPARFICNHPER